MDFRKTADDEADAGWEAACRAVDVSVLSGCTDRSERKFVYLRQLRKSPILLRRIERLWFTWRGQHPSANEFTISFRLINGSP